MICFCKICWVIDMLYVFVEGTDDEKFFSEIFFKSDAKIIQYSGEKSEKTNSFIRAIKKMPNADYIFLGDGDGKSIPNKSKYLTNKYNQLERSKLFIVQYEIESWYYAGVREDYCRKLKLKKFEDLTDKISKEKFNSKINKLTDRQYIMGLMLEVYSISLAEERNSSFKIFTDYMRSVGRLAS